MAKHEPTPLQDAIRAQQSVINVLADQHAVALHNTAVIGKSLKMAHRELSTLLNQQVAERNGR